MSQPPIPLRELLRRRIELLKTEIASIAVQLEQRQQEYDSLVIAYQKELANDRDTV
jgi:hypothetical protein